MSVQSEIDRIKGNVADSYSAVESKGGTVPQTANSANLAEAINSIPAGGSASFLVNAPLGTIVIWSGTTDNIPAGWALCDGTNGTPDLRGRFVLGQSSSHKAGSTGGKETVTLTAAQMPAHNHNLKFSSSTTAGKAGQVLSANGASHADFTNYNAIQSTGSGSAHENMPPYYTALYIQKTGVTPSDYATEERVQEIVEEALSDVGTGLPPGGTTGQVLIKASDVDGDAAWATLPGVAVVESISITSPPDKTNYMVGETFDPTGMAVLAAFSNGTFAPVDTEDLTFTPDGPLEETVTSITVSFTSGVQTVTAQQPITVSSVHIYGASWDGTSTTKWTRTDEAALFTDPVPYVAGATGYSSPFDTLQPWAGMVIEERTGGTMVAIPKFWYKLTQNGAGMEIQIADAETEGFIPSPAHMDRGDGNGERDVVYIGRYHCAASDYKSKTGEKPKANITRSAARTAIHSLGSNIWQNDFATRFTLWLLYIVEFADWNTQNTIGKGCGNNSSTENMGYTDSMPYHTGTTQSSRDTYGLGTQYRNIEGLWDNVYDWCDGCYYNSSGLMIILNPNNFSDSSGGTSAGTPSSGYPSAFAVSATGGFTMFIPTAASGSDSTYSCDYWYFSASYPCVYVGGSYNRGGSRGLFCVDCSGASHSNAGIGSRLLELP